MITVESDNMWCGSSPVGKSRKLSRHRDPCWGQFQDTLRRLERTPCLPNLATKQTPVLTLSAKKKKCQKVNRNLSWPNLKIVFFALSHQLHTPRYQLSLRTTTLMWNLLIEHQTQSQWHSMQSLIGILSSVFSILWGAVASAASRKKRCLSVEIRGWLDNGPRLPWSAARTNARYWPTSKGLPVAPNVSIRRGN